MRPSGTLAVVVGVVCAALGWFSARRLVFLAAALAPRRALPDPGSFLPTVALLVPAHNERRALPALTSALERLDYEHSRLEFVLVSDGSTDGTGEELARWASGRRAQVLALPERRGKAAALNAGLAASESELVVVLDADLRPHPDFLRRIAAPFADPRVGAAAGYVEPDRAFASAAATYAAVTAWVHQLVTSAAKDRLALHPPTLGASCFRRAALVAAGGFDPARGGEDVVPGVRVARLGWSTRFVPDAVASHPVYASLRQYWHQHVRWARSVIDARPTGRARQTPLARRIEDWLAATGYADRVAFAAAAALVAGGRLPLWVPAAYLVPPALHVAVATARAGQLARLPRVLVSTALVFAVDVAASAQAIALHALRRRRAWRPEPAASRAPLPAPSGVAQIEPELACAVLSLNDQPTLVDAVRSLLRQSVPVEVVVVNSGGGAPGERLAEAGLSGVRVVDVAERLYPGGVRNLALLHTKAPYVAYLAADCIAHEGWAERRLEHHRDGAAAVASCLTTTGSGLSEIAALLLLHNRRLASCPPSQRLLYGLSYARTLFDRYGWFREDLRAGEDTEFNARIAGEDVRWDSAVLTGHRYPTRAGELFRNAFHHGRLQAIMHGRIEGKPPRVARVLARAMYNLLQGMRVTLGAPAGSRLRYALAWPLVGCGTAAYAAGALSALRRREPGQPLPVRDVADAEISR